MTMFITQPSHIIDILLISNLVTGLQEESNHDNHVSKTTKVHPLSCDYIVQSPFLFLK